MSMLQIYWNRKELEEKMLTPPPTLSSDLEIHFMINGADITGGATTNCRFFFTQHYGALQFLFPETLGDENVHINSRDSDIVGEGFEYSLTLQPESDSLSIRYWGRGPGRVFHTIEVSLREFVEAIIEANKTLLKEAVEIWPDMLYDDDFVELLEEIAIMKEWFWERYGSVL
jgi:hypothetical protein